ncbi:hypothetical protein ACO0KY_15050 [Undibacterium sp. Dicai25W]|uniref:hypothetical protein n=1 Tax=Undibacterium sp. Dicai25W TaxID=3413034 RepID=UPI003BF11752
MRKILSISFFIFCCYQTSIVLADDLALKTPPDLGTAEIATLSVAEQIDANVKVFLDAQRRVFGRAILFCSTNQKRGDRPIEQILASYIEAYSRGTKEAMLEIVKTDKSIAQPGFLPSDRDLDMVDKQGDVFLIAVQGNPEVGCKKLGDILSSGSTTTYRDRALGSYHEYLGRRRENCAKLPQSNGCE